MVVKYHVCLPLSAIPCSARDNIYSYISLPLFTYTFISFSLYIYIYMGECPWQSGRVSVTIRANVRDNIYSYLSFSLSLSPYIYMYIYELSRSGWSLNPITQESVWILFVSFFGILMFVFYVCFLFFPSSLSLLIFLRLTRPNEETFRVRFREKKIFKLSPTI